MRAYLSTLLLAASFGLAGCSGPEPNTKRPQVSTPTPATAATPGVVSTPKDGNYNAKGKVTRINTELGSVEMDHEDIPGVMPAMRMEFNVRDKAQIKKVKVGDTVDFVLEYKQGTETIVDIKAAAK